MLAVFVLVLVAQGCALSPGRNYSREFANDPSVLESSVMGGYLHEMLGLDSEDPPPPGALIPITPELIRKQRQTERTAVPEEVASLFATP
ncbi:MAG: hypothetical protein VW339_02410, partial [Quisquiliibacterium sp.]